MIRKYLLGILAAIAFSAFVGQAYAQNVQINRPDSIYHVHNGQTSDRYGNPICNLGDTACASRRGDPQGPGFVGRPQYGAPQHQRSMRQAHQGNSRIVSVYRGTIYVPRGVDTSMQGPNDRMMHPHNSHGPQRGPIGGPSGIVRGNGFIRVNGRTLVEMR